MNNQPLKLQTKKYSESNESKQHNANNYGNNYGEQPYYAQYTDDYEYEDEYEQWNDYDECDFDPQTKKMIITTYAADKKPKHKPDPMVQSKQNAMKMIHKIRNCNRYKSHYQKRNNGLYAVIIINGKQLLIGSMTICGTHSKVLYSHKNRFQSGKHNKGGQSAARFGRIYDNKINTFIKHCATEVNKIFGNDSAIDCNGIILAGNGTMKDKLYQCKELKQNSVKSLIIKTVNTQNGGKDGFKEIHQKIRNKELFSKSESQNKAENIIIEEVMALVQNQNECDMISIGIGETIKAIKLNIVKYVVLSDGCYKYVLKKRSKPVKFIRNDMELHEIIQDMHISIGNQNRVWKIVDYVGYVKNLCRINSVELKIIGNDCASAKQFSKDLSGCIGVLYQSFEYLNE